MVGTIICIPKDFGKLNSLEENGGIPYGAMIEIGEVEELFTKNEKPKGNIGVEVGKQVGIAVVIVVWG